MTLKMHKPDLFVAEDLANKNRALVPADVSAVVHTPRLERSRILKARHFAGQHPSTWHVDASRRFVGKRFMWALKVEYQPEVIKLFLLRCVTVRAGGLAVSSFRVRCIRSCLPFC